MNRSDDKFTEQLCHTLDQSLDTLDSELEVRLSRMKYRALDRSSSHNRKRFVWGGYSVALALLLIVVFNIPQRQTVSPVLTELSILAAPEPLDFYTEDIEFYEWLSDVLDKKTQSSDYRSVVPDASPSPVADGSRRAECRQAAIPGSRADRVSRSIYG